MLTGEIRNQIDRIWDAFWSGGISNPLEVIEQITYPLFLKRLDELETAEELKANRESRCVQKPICAEARKSVGTICFGRFGFGMKEYLFARDQSPFWLPDQPNPQPVNETDMRVLVAAVRLAYDKAPERVSSSPISGMIRGAFNRGVDRSGPKDIDDHARAQGVTQPFDRLMNWKQWLNRFGRFNSRDKSGAQSGAQ